jgi:hypothetical protein
MAKKTGIIRTGFVIPLIVLSSVATISIVLPVGSGINTLAQSSSRFEDSTNIKFITVETLNKHLILEVPHSWYVMDNDDGSVLFCNDADCDKATQRLLLYSFGISPNEPSVKTFSDTLQQERDSGLTITRTQHLSDNLQRSNFKSHDPISGQNYLGIEIHQIVNNDLYGARFMVVPEEARTFLPVIERISSTWHITYDDGRSIAAANSAFNIGSRIIHDNSCANQLMISNWNVNPTHRSFNSGCGMWMNAP